MRAKSRNIECIILLIVLAVACTEHVAATTTSSSVSAGHATTGQWKSIPEDATSWKREPFKSPDIITRDTTQAAKQGAKQGTTGASPDFALQGIMKSNKHYYAIINNRTVKPGDNIEGWNVTDINRYRVTLRRDKERQIYDIYQGKIDRGTR